MPKAIVSRTSRNILTTLIFICAFNLYGYSQNYYDPEDAREHRRQVALEKKIQNRAIVKGIVCLVGFAIIGIYLKKRQFSRTNQYGTQEYSGWEEFIRSTLFKDILSIIGKALMIGALIFFVIALMPKLLT